MRKSLNAHDRGLMNRYKCFLNDKNECDRNVVRFFSSLYHFIPVILIVIRRVHITEETLQHLNGEYQVEDGDGGSRDPLLKGRITYLVIDPHKPDRIRRAKLVGVAEVHYRLL